jgi:hypothetical protein
MNDYMNKINDYGFFYDIEINDLIKNEVEFKNEIGTNFEKPIKQTSKYFSFDFFDKKKEKNDFDIIDKNQTIQTYNFTTYCIQITTFISLFFISIGILFCSK